MSTSLPATERHYTLAEIAEMWSLSKRTVRRILDKEEGIMVIGHAGDSYRPRQQTVRVPERVLQRVYSRMTSKPKNFGR